MFLKTLTIGYLIFLSVAASSCAADLSGPVRIIDADTVEVQGVVIRLYGIDAPETGQRCMNSSRKLVRPSIDAVARLAELAAHGLRCHGSEYDDYRRLIAVCSSEAGIEINSLLVREGFAWAFVKYSKDYVMDETIARNERLGIWRLACDAPWAFRAKRWDVTAQKSPNGCPIKGNISENGRVYHTPWGRDYARTKIDLAKGERWFCSEKEALEAGWRAPAY